MRAIVTRVSSASVTIEGKTAGAIEKGFLVLLGVGPEDTEKEADRLVDKITHLRVFTDENDKMNLALEQVGGQLLVVSQFTLYADLKSRRLFRRCRQNLYHGVLRKLAGDSRQQRIARQHLTGQLLLPDGSGFLRHHGILQPEHGIQIEGSLLRT